MVDPRRPPAPPSAPQFAPNLRGLLACLVLLSGTAAAFASLPPDANPHDDVTKVAAEAAGWPENATRALLEAVRKPDLDEIKWEPHEDEPTRIDPNEHYRSEHHCDRIPPEDNATAFRRTVEYVDQQRRMFRAVSEPTDRVQALGRALHALQDCYSHSNYVDLEPAQRDAFDVALRNGSDSAPHGLVLVAVDPGADRPGLPDDPYPHDSHAKDSDDMNDESRRPLGNGTKFDAAARAATNATRAVLEHELGLLSPREVAALGDANVEAPDQNPAPAAGWLAVLACLGAVGVATRRWTG